MRTARITPDVDSQNARFWNELCGSNLARVLDIRDDSPQSLQRYDDAYLKMYPYLRDDLAVEQLSGRKVLEIGLGYGTVGQLLASSGCEYYGIDVAEGPVRLMRHRLIHLGQDDSSERVICSSALSLPYEEKTFDCVYAVGSLHHTGDLPKAISEVYRVLKPEGRALVSVYHRHSLRRMLRNPLAWWKDREEQGTFREKARYDFNAVGDEAPHTDYVSKSQARKLFSEFGNVRVETRNCDRLTFCRGRFLIPREKLLDSLGRIAGLDLYVWAIK